ncbi:MAG TPA: prepilin peptidase [Syntrophales bacterium]|nr:prepilin peptidase [Syntrophales bacterium]HOL58811.1 prepilin peptidase [Syntrophales bacterium]HPO35138.1 prepilin peptidase [Syntrophales bacterium]
MYAIAFILGAIVGSFLNVCISRLPMGESIVKPPSHCPTCGARIFWYDNIPIFSYLFLRGRCRRCHTPISYRYPLVELVSALGAVAVWAQFGPGVEGAIAFVFFCTLIVVSFIDLEHQIIPHVITLPGIPIFLMVGVGVMGVKLTDALIGLAAGIAALHLIAVYYEAITGIEGMGGGDVNLAGLIGAFFGWQSLPLVLFSAAFFGACLGLIFMVFKGRNLRQAIPFGPFLSLGALIYLFFGRALWGFFLTV